MDARGTTCTRHQGLIRAELAQSLELCDFLLRKEGVCEGGGDDQWKAGKLRDVRSYRVVADRPEISQPIE